MKHQLKRYFSIASYVPSLLNAVMIPNLLSLRHCPHQLIARSEITDQQHQR